MTVSKSHHFVPQLLLKNFTDANGRLWCCRKGMASVTDRVPREVYFRNHFHTEIGPDGTKDTSLEDEFSRLESASGPVIQKFLENARLGKYPRLSSEERSVWDSFLYAQWKRTPLSVAQRYIDTEFEKNRDMAVRNFKEEFRELKPEEEKWLADSDVQKRVKQSVRVDSLRRYPDYIRRFIAELGVGIGVLEKPSKAFVIGSSPVVRIVTAESQMLGSPGVGLYLPIASDVVVCTLAKGQSSGIATITKDSWVRDFNLLQYNQSDEIASRSEKLTRSICGIRSKKG